MEELGVVQAAADRLGLYGDVELVYLTAEFNPFSGGRRPDLLFRPSTGPSEGQAFLVETRFYDSAPDDLAATLAEHRAFVSTEDASELHFALATSCIVPMETREKLASMNIHVIAPVTSEEDLVEEVMDWTGCRTRD